MPERVVRCHGCGTSGRFEDVVPRRAECDRCGASLHCCRNCQHYDPSVYNECRETSAERVVEKEASNFCDYFTPVSAAAGAPDAADASGREALEKLFRK